MVYYFTSTVTDPPATIYVGKDKFENEELIKFGWDCDVWLDPLLYSCPFSLTNFSAAGYVHVYLPPHAYSIAIHVLSRQNKKGRIIPTNPPSPRPQFHADNLSSAHIYLRLTPDQKWDSLPPALLEDCAQLTKANSIEGNKKDNVTIIYTPWSNLHKTAAMATGQVGFHDPRKTRRILTPTRSNPIINRLQKTRTIISADELPAAKENYLKGLRAEKRREAERKRKEEERVQRERREEKEGRERGWRELAEGGGGEEGGRSNEEGWDEDDFM